MKVQLKDLKTLTVNNVKKEVKELTDSQLDMIFGKLKRAYEIVSEESNTRFKNKIEDEIDDELDETIVIEGTDEVQGDEEEA